MSLVVIDACRNVQTVSLTLFAFCHQRPAPPSDERLFRHLKGRFWITPGSNEEGMDGRNWNTYCLQGASIILRPDGTDPAIHTDVFSQLDRPMMWTASIEFAESEGYTACRSNWLPMTEDWWPWCIISLARRTAMGRRTEPSHVRDQVLPGRFVATEAWTWKRSEKSFGTGLNLQKLPA